MFLFGGDCFQKLLYVMVVEGRRAGATTAIQWPLLPRGLGQASIGSTHTAAGTKKGKFIVSKILIVFRILQASLDTLTAS